MTISNLTVSASGGATNTLFLSNAGLTTPLSVLSILDVDANGALVADSSVVQVSSNLFVTRSGGTGVLTITNSGAVYDVNGCMGCESSFGSLGGARRWSPGPARCGAMAKT